MNSLTSRTYKKRSRSFSLWVWVCWGNMSFNPIQELLDVGVDTRPPRLSTAYSPACGSSKNVFATLLTHERSSTVSLTAVHLTLLVAGADHLVGDNFPITFQVLLFTGGVVNDGNTGDAEFSGAPARLVRSPPPGHRAVGPRREVTGSGWQTDWDHCLVISRQGACHAEECNVVVEDTVVVFGMHTDFGYSWRKTENQSYYLVG